MIEATPIKLSYVIYPGELFYDGQLVAIEENRLVFRREETSSCSEQVIFPAFGKSAMLPTGEAVAVVRTLRGSPASG